MYIIVHCRSATSHLDRDAQTLLGDLEYTLSCAALFEMSIRDLLPDCAQLHQRANHLGSQARCRSSV
jgi:hypothetical protein